MSQTTTGTNAKNPKNQNSRKFWNFVDKKATNPDSDSPPELILYGDISSTSWFGDEVTPKQFDADLTALGDVDNIVVRINSGGGDVFAANAIYTRLKDHKAKITVKIDGWAASAATIIAMAGDVIQIPANGVFMIHNPQMGVSGYFGANDFVKMSEELAVIKQSIIKGYSLKTGKDESELSALMDKEMWLDGKQAVENGFCDEIMFGEANTEIADVNHVVVNSVSIDISEFNNIPKSLLNCRNSGSFANSKPKQITDKGGSEQMEIQTVDQLKAAFPELAAQIEASAAAAERKRIKDIESVALPGYEAIVSKAKFDEPVDSGAVAMQIIAKQKEQGKAYLDNVSEEINDSGINEVKESAVSATGETTKINPYDAAIDNLFPVK